MLQGKIHANNAMIQPTCFVGMKGGSVNMSLNYRLIHNDVKPIALIARIHAITYKQKC